MSRGRRVAVVTFALLICGCAPEPLVFPDWTVPVPDGTPIHEYAAVPLADRTEMLELERDLVIREAFGRGIYRAQSLAVAPDGKVFLLEFGNLRVVVFDPDGNPLTEFGRQGQGPGEFQMPYGIGLVNDKVIVSDIRNARLSVFDTTGTPLADHTPEGRFWATDIVGFGDQMIVINAVGPAYPPRGVEPRPRPWVAGLFEIAGTEQRRLVELEWRLLGTFAGDNIVGGLQLTTAAPHGAITAEGTVYATNGDEYQVVAVLPDGSTAWALRTNWVPDTVTESHQQATLAFLRDRMPDMGDAEFRWPDRYAAIRGIEVDGRGNLFVFPYRYRPRDLSAADEPVPVDVYSPEGELVFAGLTTIDRWGGAAGEHIYAIETDPDTDEQIVVRYRIRTPLQ